MMMKALAAKIFTVTGMYDVLDRPHEINSISPIRMIIGGDMPTPKVDEAQSSSICVCLYLPNSIVISSNSMVINIIVILRDIDIKII